MSGVNKVILIGRLGKDPELRNLESGKQVCTFSIATTETYKDKTTGERKDVTEWHNIVMWEKLAGIAAKYLKKGEMVYLEGKLRTRSWEKEGVTRYTTEVVADEMTMLTPKGAGDSSNKPNGYSTNGSANNNSNGKAYASSSQASQGPPPTEPNDDLPF